MKDQGTNNSDMHENSEGLASSHESELDSNTTLSRYGRVMNIVTILKHENEKVTIELRLIE